MSVAKVLHQSIQVIVFFATRFPVKFSTTSRSAVLCFRSLLLFPLGYSHTCSSWSSRAVWSAQIMSIISQLDEVCKSKAGAKTWSKGGPQGPKLETLVLYQVSIVWKVEWSSWWRRLKQFKSHGCRWIFTLNFVCLVSIKKQQIKSIGVWMGRQCCYAFVCSYLECVSLCTAMSCVKWALETICLFGSNYFPLSQYISNYSF